MDSFYPVRSRRDANRFSHTLSSLIRFVFLMLVLTSSSLSSESITGIAFGTTYQIKLGESITRELEEQIRDEIDRELKRIESIFSLYEIESELSRWNASPSNDWYPIASEVVQLVNAAQTFWKASQGSFDPTILPVIRQWNLESLRPDWSPPNKLEISEAMKNVGFRHLEFRQTPPQLRRIQPNVQLDLNSLVEGWALDRLMELLRSRGINNFLMELGGDFISHGRQPTGQLWRVSIENPADPRKTPLQVELFNQALCTSGNYRNGRDFEGKWYSHTLDAKTGYPSNFNLSLTSVVATSALEADGWATTLQVSPSNLWSRLANSNRIAAVRIERLGENLEISRSTLGQTLFATQSKASSQANRSDRVNPSWGAIIFVALVSCLLIFSVVRYSVSRNQ
jgi:FAD:protein FMN transferase